MYNIKEATISKLTDQYIISDGMRSFNLMSNEYAEPLEALWVNDVCIVTIGWDEPGPNQILAFDSKKSLLWKYQARILDNGNIDRWVGPAYKKTKDVIYIVTNFGLAFPIKDLLTGELGEPEETR